MIKATLALLVIFLMVGIYGCSSNERQGTNDEGGNPTSSAGAGSTASNSSEADNSFVNKAAQGGLAEVELGRLATQRASNSQVKEFGQRMVNDHSKANNELKETLGSRSTNLPTSLNSKDQALMDRLSRLSGKDFDKAYMKAMVDDHTEDVSEFQNEVNSGQNTDVKRWAEKTLPTLQEHLSMARDINDKISNDKTSNK